MWGKREGNDVLCGEECVTLLGSVGAVLQLRTNCSLYMTKLNTTHCGASYS